MGDDVVWFWGEFLGVWAWGLFFCGMNGGREWWSDGRGVSHQCCAGWLQGLSFLVMCREVVGHRRCVGCGWGEFFGVLS